MDKLKLHHSYVKYINKYIKGDEFNPLEAKRIIDLINGKELTYGCEIPSRVNFFNKIDKRLMKIKVFINPKDISRFEELEINSIKESKIEKLLKYNNKMKNIIKKIMYFKLLEVDIQDLPYDRFKKINKEVVSYIRYNDNISA